VLVLTAVAAVLLATAATRPSATMTLTVASSIDGKTVLPHRTRWIARPSIPSAQIKEVDFVIDGKLAWAEHAPPYVYSDDDGSHLGYLVSSWLTPGRHRFAVKAIALDGRTAVHTTTLRVTPPPDPPAVLAGRWQRTLVDTSAAPSPGSSGNPTDTYAPAGTYTMVIDRRFVQVRFPGTFRTPQSDHTGEGWILDSDYDLAAGRLRATGPVTFATFHEQAEYGWWCYPDGPSGDYTWSVAGDTLTLTPAAGADPCGIRGFIWAGQWTRAPG
jgi:hypothetical protein